MNIGVFLHQWFDKVSAGTSTYTLTAVNIENWKLDAELHKPTFTNFCVLLIVNMHGPFLWKPKKASQLLMRFKTI